MNQVGLKKTLYQIVLPLKFAKRLFLVDRRPERLSSAKKDSKLSSNSFMIRQVHIAAQLVLSDYTGHPSSCQDLDQG